MKNGKIISVYIYSIAPKEKLYKFTNMFSKKARRDRICEQYTLVCEIYENFKENNYIDEFYINHLPR